MPTKDNIYKTYFLHKVNSYKSDDLSSIKQILNFLIKCNNKYKSIVVQFFIEKAIEDNNLNKFCYSVFCNLLRRINNNEKLEYILNDEIEDINVGIGMNSGNYSNSMKFITEYCNSHQEQKGKYVKILPSELLNTDGDIFDTDFMRDNKDPCNE